MDKANDRTFSTEVLHGVSKKQLKALFSNLELFLKLSFNILLYFCLYIFFYHSHICFQIWNNISLSSHNTTENAHANTVRLKTGK